jgi:signal transduction histidine kinase
MIAFRVADKGYGIPEELQAKMFERFESRPNGSGHRGAGLGLSIVKSLVELHGGSVSLSSAPGRGTEVTALFPREHEGFTALPDEAAPLRYGTARAG